MFLVCLPLLAGVDPNILEQPHPAVVAGFKMAAIPEGRHPTLSFSPALVESSFGGKVVGPDGKPVASARIQTTAPGAYTAVTDAAGEYRIKSLRLRERWNSYLRVVSADRRLQADMQAKGEEPIGMEGPAPTIKLTPAREVRVLVIDDKGKPVENAWVGVSGGMAGETVTAKDGTASIWAPSDKLLSDVFAAKAGVGFDFRLFAHSEAARRSPKQLSQEHTEPVQLELRGMLSVRCRVVDAKGNSIAGAPVRPTSLNSPERGGHFNLFNTIGLQMEADLQGEAELACFPADLIGAEVRILGRTDSVEGEAIAVIGRPDPAEIRIPDRADIPVVVKDAKGNPVAGIRVLCNGGKGSIGTAGDRLAYTNDAGEARLDPTTDCCVSLRAGDDRRGYSLPASLVVRSGETPKQVELTLAPIAKVAGRLVDATGAPVIGASLFLRLEPVNPPEQTTEDERRSMQWNSFERGFRIGDAKTDGDGRFTFVTGPGAHRLAGSFRRGSIAFDVQPGETEKEIDVSREYSAPPVDRRVPLSGRVVMKGEPGKAIEEARVEIQPLFDSEIRDRRELGLLFSSPPCITNVRGRFETKVAPFTSLYLAYAENGTLAGSAVHTGGGEVTIKVAPARIRTGTLIDAATGKPIENRD
ncbi:MAG TPA: carboxypeptidase-like regulatory domain-containing protein, partial [Planctomycetia bacterium]|nr:carboxypeptidase-like regulatory domain-containing protein [Planctomycetia bacterium]